MSAIDQRPPASTPVSSESSTVLVPRGPASDPADFASADLSKEQVIVLRAIAGGKSICAAAREAGINRCTIHRWQHDPQFQHWLRAWQFQTKDSGRNILLTLIERATRIIERALEKDDVRVAITLLSKLGVLTPSDGPALSQVDGPAPSAVGGPAANKTKGPGARSAEGPDSSRVERSPFAPLKPPQTLEELQQMINELETKFGDMLPGGRR